MQPILCGDGNTRVTLCMDGGRVLCYCHTPPSLYEWLQTVILGKVVELEPDGIEEEYGPCPCTEPISVVHRWRADQR